MDDPFFYRPATGQWFKAVNLGGGTFSFYGYAWATGRSVTVTDFDGDGRGDLFLYNRGDVADANHGRWFRAMSDATRSFNYREGEARWTTDWTITPADFNADGTSDLFLDRSPGSLTPNSAARCTSGTAM